MTVKIMPLPLTKQLLCAWHFSEHFYLIIPQSNPTENVSFKSHIEIFKNPFLKRRK